MERVPLLRVSQSDSQHFRRRLPSEGALDVAVSLVKDADGAVPTTCRSQLDLQSASGELDSHADRQPPRRSKRRENASRSNLERVVRALLERRGAPWEEELRREIPRRFQRHGDLVLLGENCFTSPLWKNMGDELWGAVAAGLGAERLARMSRISRDGFRSPAVTMLRGADRWVEHVDNGIRYQFDVTKSMFSAGNITEKLRVAALDCTGETVVDLYAGIGYFTLPYLVHAKASRVVACEWNPHAVEALQRNLEANGVADRCTVHQGDNRQLRLSDLADRVNLGLVPSSEDGWPVACRLLRRASGGVLHIHHNVTSRGASGREGRRRAWRAWADGAAHRVASLLRDQTGVAWSAAVRHLERVKSYAPHVDHVVLDLDCRPLGESNREPASVGVAVEPARSTDDDQTENCEADRQEVWKVIPVKQFGGNDVDHEAAAVRPRGRAKESIYTQIRERLAFWSEAGRPAPSDDEK